MRGKSDRRRALSSEWEAFCFIRKITSSLRAPTVDPGYPGAVRNLRASGHPGVPPGTGSFF
jgi:hypothetical protein